MDDLLTVPNFAKQLNLSPTTVYLAIQEKRLEVEERYGRLLIPRRELKRFKKRKNGSRKKVLRAA